MRAIVASAFMPFKTQLGADCDDFSAANEDFGTYENELSSLAQYISTFHCKVSIGGIKSVRKFYRVSRRQSHWFNSNINKASNISVLQRHLLRINQFYLQNELLIWIKIDHIWQLFQGS